MDFDSSGDRLFVMFDNMSLVEISMKSGLLVNETDIRKLEGIELEPNEAPKVFAFALQKETNIIAFSTSEAVYLLDFETDIKFSRKIPLVNSVYISFVDIYVVMMVSNEEDTSEATLKCYMLYGGEEGSLSIKRFMG